MIETLVVVVFAIYLTTKIMKDSATAREKQYQKESKEALIQKLLNE